MQAKHTPGPWTYTRTGGVTTSDDQRLLMDGVSLPLGNNRDIATAAANARLVAAAPDLLAACEEVRRWLEEDELIGPDELSDEAKGMLAILRGAIAKAKGGDA